MNKLHDVSIKVANALVYLANNPRPSGGEETYNTAHLYQLATMLRHEVMTSVKPQLEVKLPEGLSKNITDDGYYRAVCDMMDCIRAAGGKMEGDD